MSDVFKNAVTVWLEQKPRTKEEIVNKFEKVVDDAVLETTKKIKSDEISSLKKMLMEPPKKDPVTWRYWLKEFFFIYGIIAMGIFIIEIILKLLIK